MGGRARAEPPLQPVVLIVRPGVALVGVAYRELPQHDRGVRAAREARDVAVLAGEVGRPPPGVRVALDVLVVAGVAIGYVVEDQVETSEEGLVERGRQSRLLIHRGQRA